jgi:hypothetical protein
MNQFFDPSGEEPPVVQPRRHELAVEILKLLTPALGLLLFVLGLSAKYPWLSKPWVTNTLVILGIAVVAWFAKPRFSAWWHRIGQRKRDQQFIVTNEARLRELMDQFAEFISDNNTRSLLYMARSSYPQMTELEPLLTGYIGSWFHSYREQLAFPTHELQQFLARCREFTNLVSQFNTSYALRAERLIAAAKALPEQSTTQLEAFREDYNDFLRNLERWAKGISAYLQSLGVTDQPAQWRLAPTIYFEKPKSFRQTQPSSK